MKSIKVFWTGGWDSTFRIVELSRCNVEIEPIYVIDPNRKSVKYELSAMNNIINALKKKSDTLAIFKDIKIIKLEDIVPDEEISNAYKIINKETGLGSQHEWLAWLGKTIPNIEMGTEAGSPDTSHIIHAIQKYGVLKYKDDIGYLDKNESTKEGLLVLGWFRFPIIKKTEVDMLKIIKEIGYEDVMKFIWFCHTPINNKPCGVCHPCHVKMESNMEWLLPKKSQRRYKIHMFLEQKFGIYFAELYSRIIRKVGR